VRPLVYHRPRCLDEARSLKAEIPGSRFIAGGTDLLVQVRNGGQRPTALISLRSMPELVGVTADGATRIGAMTSLSELVEHPVIGRRHPLLASALATVGSVQIRNVATLGGNLCNAAPCADGGPPLLVLGARVGIDGPQARREVAVEELFVGPGETCLGADEILAEILVDPPPPGARGIFLKQRRVAMDLALASVAVWLDMADDGEMCLAARVAVGSVAPTPLRLPRVEAALAGRVLTPELVSEAKALARQDIAPISDVRASADYRRHLTGVLFERAVSTLLGWRSA